ncbi:MAG: DUF308 domain-containing protein [Pseudonocardiaceae bacterium]
MTVPDPEEQDRREADGSKDTDATFASIIASWQSEPDAPRWPTDEHLAEQDPAERDAAERDAARADLTPEEHRLDDGDEDHFEPPEPPPLPVPGPRTLGGLVLLAIGVLLLIRPSLLSLGENVGTPLGLLAVTAGIGWLVLGLRSGPPPEGWDDGARL